MKLTASSILLNMCLLKLPVDFRAKMDDRLRPVSPEYILSRDLMAEPFNDVIAGELEKPTSIVATVGFNTIPQGNVNNQFNQGYKNNNLNKGQKQHKKCLLCSKGKGNHKSYHCPVYNTGLLARERMKALGRCQYCTVVLSEHGPECSHRAHCTAHPHQRHMFWLCANYINFTTKLGNQINPPQQHQQQYHHPQQNQYQQPQYNPYPQQSQHQQQYQYPYQQNPNQSGATNSGRQQGQQNNQRQTTPS